MFHYHSHSWLLGFHFHLNTIKPWIKFPRPPLLRQRLFTLPALSPFFILLASCSGGPAYPACTAPLWTAASCRFCGQPLNEHFFLFYYLKSHMDARQAWLITLHPSDFKTRAPATTGPLYSEWKPPHSHTPAVRRTERMASSILKPLYRTREVSWQCVFVERRWRAASRSVRKAASSGLWLLPVHKVCKWTLLEASRKKRFIQRSKSTFSKCRCYKIRFPVRPTMLKHGCYTRTEAS